MRKRESGMRGWVVLVGAHTARPLLVWLLGVGGGLLAYQSAGAAGITRVQPAAERGHPLAVLLLVAHSGCPLCVHAADARPPCPHKHPCPAGDEHPGRIAADIIFVLQEKPHPAFRRDGNDLIYTHRCAGWNSAACCGACGGGSDFGACCGCCSCTRAL